jgi:hypothetical protein
LLIKKIHTVFIISGILCLISACGEAKETSTEFDRDELDIVAADMILSRLPISQQTTDSLYGKLCDRYRVSRGYIDSLNVAFGNAVQNNSELLSRLEVRLDSVSTVQPFMSGY